MRQFGQSPWDFSPDQPHLPHTRVHYGVGNGNGGELILGSGVELKMDLHLRC